MTRKQLKDIKIRFEIGIESDESVESERDLDRDARTTNRARIVIEDDILKRDKKGHKKDKKAKKDKKERKKQKKERKRARRENQGPLNVSPGLPQIDEMVQEEDEADQCFKCAMRAPSQGKCISCQLKEI